MPQHLHKRTIHYGYAHVFPLSNLVKKDYRDLEGYLEDSHLEIQGKKVGDNYCSFNCITTEQSGIGIAEPFLLKLAEVGSIQSGSQEPVYSFSVILNEKANIHYISDIFWLINNLLIEKFSASGLILTKECTIRMLVGTLDNKPSFQYLWEDLLGQQTSVLNAIGANLRGGGLRFVNDVEFDFVDGHKEIADRNFLFESFLRDPRYLFAEGTYNWKVSGAYANAEALKEAITQVCTKIPKNMDETINALIKEAT